MNKILISVYVITLDAKYDLFVPINIKTSKMIDLIQKSIVELSLGHYQINQTAHLYDGKSGMLINTNNIVKYSGLQNGSNVLLI